MKHANLKMMVALCASLGFGCSGEDGGEGPTTRKDALSGRMGAAGHQQAEGAASPRAAGLARADRVQVVAAADGSFLADAVLSSQGRYSFPELPAVEGPVVVQALAGDATVGEVLVPRLDGAGAVAMPISVETTAEAEAFAALVADGMAVADIDVVGLMDRVTGRMAAEVSDGAELAAGLALAQSAWEDGLAAAGAAGAEAEAARQAAYAQFAAAVDLGDGAAQAAWAAYRDATDAALQAGGADAEARVTAESAAGFALSQGLEGTAAAEEAVAAAALLVAEVEQRAQVAAAVEADLPALAGQVERAYAAYTQALATADAAAAAAAHGQLADALVEGEGSVRAALMAAAGSRLAGLEGLEGLPGLPGLEGLEGLDGIIAQALAEVDQAMAQAGAALEAGLAALDDARAAGAVYAELRAEITRSLSASLEGLGAGLGLAVELELAVHGGAAGFLAPR